MIWWNPTGCWPTVTHTLQSSLDIHMRLSTALGSAAFTLECRLKLKSLRSSRARDPRQLVEMSPKWLQTKDVQPETSEAVTLPDAQPGAAIFQQIACDKYCAYSMSFLQHQLGKQNSQLAATEGVIRAFPFLNLLEHCISMKHDSNPAAGPSNHLFVSRFLCCFLQEPKKTTSFTPQRRKLTKETCWLEIEHMCHNSFSPNKWIRNNMFLLFPSKHQKRAPAICGTILSCLKVICRT